MILLREVIAAKRKGVDAMTTATLLKNDEYQFADEMESYVKKMKEDRNINGTEKHRAEALAALKRTGVLTKDGNTKNRIVTWE